MTITHTIIQQVVPDEIRGRVAAVYSMHVGGSMAFANLLYGRLADEWSAGDIMAVAGGGLYHCGSGDGDCQRVLARHLLPGRGPAGGCGGARLDGGGQALLTFHRHPNTLQPSFQHLTTVIPA